MKNIAIFASGSGTNAENIVRTFRGGNRLHVALVLTNRRNAGVIERMERLGVPVQYVPNEAWDRHPDIVLNLLRQNDIDIVVLAGFMHYVPTEIIDAYRGRILNIHPSLLPSYGGKGMYGHHVHEAVIDAGEEKSGVTVHLVTEEMDRGEIIMQESVDITPQDTPESLEAKIHPVEYALYPRAIVRLCERLEAEEIAQEAMREAVGEQPIEAPAQAAPEYEEPLKRGEEPKSVQQSWAEALGVPLPEQPLTPPVPIAEQAPLEQPEHVEPQPVLNAQNPDHPMPKTYMAWAIVATLVCCMIPGIVAIVYASQVSNKYYSGDFDGAERASHNAEIWIIASIVTGVLCAALYMPLSMLF